MSKWRTIRREPGAPGCLIYLCGPGGDADHDGIGDLDEAIAAALPGHAIAATGDSGYGAAVADVNAGLAACGASTLRVLAGFSAGCQGVRQQLWNGLQPELVVAIDGTSGPWGDKPPNIPSNARELRVWPAYVAAGGRLVVTATSQRYTQRLPRVAGQQGPFAATSTVIARAFDWPEAEALPALQKPLAVYPGAAALERHDGNLHAYIYAGTDCDRDAHSAQLVHVLPEMLRRHAAPGTEPAWTLGGKLAQLGADLSEWAGDVFGAIVEAEPNIAMEHLERALAELGISEIPGTKSNPRIDEYLAVAMRNGKRLGLRGDDQFSWCACFFSWCGLPPDMTPCASVAEMVTQAKATGRWRPADTFHDPKPGDAALFKRSGQDPRTGGLGHIARVKVAPDASGNYVSVGGNEGAGVVKLTERNLSDPTLIGWFVYDA